MMKAQAANSITHAGFNGGFSGSVEQAWTALMFNLYTNPQEDEAISIRHIPAAVPMLGELQRYQAVLKKSPNRFNSLFGAGRASVLSGDTVNAGLYYKQLVAMADPKSTRPELNTARSFLQGSK